MFLIEDKPQPCLPNQLSELELINRQAELKEKQVKWIYESPKTIPDVSFVRGPPCNIGQMPCAYWFFLAMYKRAKVELNFIPFSAKALLRTTRMCLDTLLTDKTDSEKVDTLIQKYRDTDLETIEQVEKKLTLDLKLANISDSNIEENSLALKPYRGMYRILTPPKKSAYFLRDDVFNRMRTAGFNPISIFRVRDTKQLPFPIQDDDLPDNDTIAKAIREKRLYAQDFSFLKHVEQEADSKKLVPVANAIYLVPDPTKDLITIAIQVNSDIVRPPSGSNGCVSRWNIAKLALNVADATHHELVAHLSRTHLLVEPFVAATHRQLSTSHPLYMLLHPHFEGTIYINDVASRNLIAPRGDVDRIFAGDIASVMRMCSDITLENNFNASMPDVEIETRGVKNNMINMPYVTDALDHWHALLEWVGTYLRHYYKSKQDIEDDRELQAWADELVSPTCGKVKGFGDNSSGRIESVEYLIRAVAFVIFSASVQHASVNFPQKSLMSYAPFVSGALWTPPPDADETANVSWWHSTLAPIRTAIEQVSILEVIGGLYYTKLGQYRSSDLPNDPVIKMGLKTYQTRLNEIDKRIVRRERDELLKYDYLRPMNIPQSINI